MRKQTKKEQPQKSFSYHLGNFLLIISALMFFLIFYPVASVYLFPPKIIEATKITENYLTVPKINAQAPVIYGVDPFNQKEYQEILKKGIAQAKGTALPGEGGTVFIFAHSSGNPLEITNYNTIFLRLGEIEKNDEILINKDGKQYKYSVTEKKIVWPNEVEYLEDKKDQLILQTCWPIGTSLKRLLVFAKPV